MHSYEAGKRPPALIRRKTRKWFFVLGASLTILFSGISQNDTNHPPLLRQTTARAVKPTSSAPLLVVDKKLFFERASLGTVSSIQPVRLQTDSQSAFWVAAEWGAVSVTSSGKPRLSVRFEHPSGKVTPVDMDGDGNFEFLSRGGGQEETRLYDHQGHLLWKYGLGEDPSVRDAACGDLDGDGELECILAMNEDGGIRLLDKNGRLRWVKPEQNVWHVETLDLDGDGKEEILHTNATGRFRIRNAEGKIVRELPGNNPIYHFSTCRWQNPDSGWFILNNNNRAGIHIIDFEGNIAASIPCTAKGYEAELIPVRFKREEPLYFALLVCNCTPRRDSHLFIYNPENEIVYEETFIPSQAALQVIRDKTTGEETLLVGEGEGRVWKYRLVPAGSKN